MVIPSNQPLQGSQSLGGFQHPNPLLEFRCDLDHPADLYPDGFEFCIGDGASIGSDAYPIRVTTGCEQCLIGVSRRHDDSTPVMKGIVKCQERALLSTMRVLSACKA